MKRTEVSSITQLPTDWCDILTGKMRFIATACTKEKEVEWNKEDKKWGQKPHRRKMISDHIYRYYCRSCKKYDFDIVVDENRITDKSIVKYVEELNKVTKRNYVYNEKLWG